MPQSSPVTNLFLPLLNKIPLHFPPASCRGMPMWKPMCYIPPSPLHIPLSLSQKLSKSFPHKIIKQTNKAHIPRTLGTSHFKVSQYSSHPSLLCPSLCPFHRCPFPLHSVQVISFSCPGEGPLGAPYSASPRISCHILLS